MSKHYFQLLQNITIEKHENYITRKQNRNQFLKGLSKAWPLMVMAMAKRAKTWSSQTDGHGDGHSQAW